MERELLYPDDGPGCQARSRMVQEQLAGQDARAEVLGEEVHEEDVMVLAGVEMGLPEPSRRP